MALANGDVGQIEQFYAFNSKRYAVKKLLKFVPFNFKIYQATKDLADAILKINECLLFCNLTDNRILINIDNIREKVLLLNSNINKGYQICEFATRGWFKKKNEFFTRTYVLFLKVILKSETPTFNF